MNFKDVMIGLGQIPYSDIGLECSGVVTATGRSVQSLTVGDRVCGLTRGGYSNSTRVLQSMVTRIPDTLSFTAAASIPVIFWFVLLQPIISLFKQIRSTETMSRCSRAPPKRRKTDQEKYNSTAYYSLVEVARLEPGESVLIHAVRLPQPILPLFNCLGAPVLPPKE